MVNKLSGCMTGVDNNGNIVVKPVVFLGGTVLSFNASLGVGPTQESTLTVEIINDCAADEPKADNGGLFHGEIKIGSPAYFSVCEAMNKNPGDDGCFEFGGIVTNVIFEQTSSGETYRLTMVDPRSLLENFTIVTSKHVAGPIKHRNYFNAFAYYEHNTLPLELKYKDADNDTILLPGSPGSDSPITDPIGDDTETDCDVFGTADSNDRGMSYRKILQALLNDNDGDGPMVYSPNYGEPFNPPVEAPLNDFLNNRTLHEGNVFRLDLSDMPDPPQYYRVPGPSISLLQFINEVCDVLGREFIVTLEKDSDNINGEPFIIKVKTKKIAPAANNLVSQIMPYQGASTSLSYGKELRIDKSRYVLLGDQRHDIYQSAEIEFYFGEDSNGDPIVAKPSADGCGFEIDIEVNALNASLNCPLFDKDADTLLERKVTITEYDIRTALSSLQLWKARIGNPNIPGDFNAVLRRNFPNLETELMSVVVNGLGEAFAATSNFIGMRAVIDAANVVNESMVATLAHNQAKDLEIIHAFISNLGKTYYGKQYIVTLDGEMCVQPVGKYDENYFRIRPEGEEDTGKIEIDYTYDCDAERDITIDNPLQIIKEKTYTHTPTNAGGWWEKCETLLGLSDDGAKLWDNFYDGVSLHFFRGDDDPRIQPFARFDSSDTVVKFKAGFGHRELDPNAPGVILPTDIIDTTQEGEVIEATCGALDISQLNPDDYLAIRKNGGSCTPPVKKPININQPVPGMLIEETKEFIQEPTALWMKCEVEEKIYHHNDKNKCVIKFNSPCLKKLCGDQNLWHEALLFLSEALVATSGLLQPSPSGDIPSPSGDPPAPSGDPPAPSGDPPAPSGDSPAPFRPAKSVEFVCGIPIPSGLMQSQSALDSSSVNSKGFFPSAELPTAVAIPVRNNLITYGPWYSENFKTNSGGVQLDQDADLAPWVYGSTKQMDSVAKNLLKEAERPLSEIETGSIDYPYWPELRLGFLDNGPNLTSINVAFGGNGVNTNYNFQSYTTKFGKLGNLENQQLKESAKNKQKLIKLIGQKNIEKNKIDRKLKKNGKQVASIKEPTNLRHMASLQRVMCGEMYNFYNLGESGVSNQRTIVGTDTLEKNTLELRYDYEKKAFYSLDGLYSPISISGANIPIDSGHYLPRFAQLEPSAESNSSTIKHKSSPILPIPPFYTGVYSGLDQYNLQIHNLYLNPLTNPSGIPYHSGDCLGHSIDIVGREKNIPSSGQLSSLYKPDDSSRYSNDYRFIGMRGPIVLHSWGYDLDGKPIPNFIDSENSAKSGIFVTTTGSGEDAVGLKDQFLGDWLQKPATWPVGPIDLRFDRERGVWVSPPPYKIIVAILDENLDQYSTATASVISKDNDHNLEFGPIVYDKDGQKINTTYNTGTDAKIKVADRLGISYSAGTKIYCYYDTFKSEYIILQASGGGEIRLGKISGTWLKGTMKTVTQLLGNGGTISGSPTFTAMNWFADISVDCGERKVACALVDSTWILISAEC